jgi:hypothetical protein
VNVRLHNFDAAHETDLYIPAHEEVSVGPGVAGLAMSIRVFDGVTLKELARFTESSGGWWPIEPRSHAPVGPSYKYCEIEENR